MKIYKVDVSSDYCAIAPNKLIPEITRMFNAGVLVDDDFSVELRRHNKKPVPDISFAYGMIVSPIAYEKLYPLLQGKVQVLICPFENSNYYMLNVIDVLDALDMNKSEVMQFTKNFAVVKHVFDPNIIEDHHLFAIKGEHIVKYVSQAFVDIVQSNGLTGINFKLVWDSDSVTSKLPIQEEAVPISIETTSGSIYTTESSLEDAIKLLDKIDSGVEDAGIFSASDGFFQFYGYKNHFYGEIMFDGEHNKGLLYTLVNSSSLVCDVKKLTTPFGSYTVMENELVTRQEIEILLMMLYKQLSIKAIVNSDLKIIKIKKS